MGGIPRAGPIAPTHHTTIVRSSRAVEVRAKPPNNLGGLSDIRSVAASIVARALWLLVGSYCTERGRDSQPAPSPRVKHATGTP